MKAKEQTLPVSERALLQRLNRRLKAEGRIGHMVKKLRGTEGYYVLDLDRNAIVQMNLTLTDLEEMAREYKALAPYESLER
jgi:hypothetical protein